MLGKENYLNNSIGRLDDTSMKFLNLAFVLPGDTTVKAGLVLVITQLVFFLHETSQGRASPDEPGGIILNFHLEIPFPFHQRAKFFL
jgi:hypothetical protein